MPSARRSPRNRSASRPEREARAHPAVAQGVNEWLRLRLVADLGRVRRRRERRGGVSYFLDFRPKLDRRLYSLHGVALTHEATAQRLLEQIRGLVADKRSLDEVLARYLPKHAKPNLVPARTEAWLEVKRREVAAGDRSPGYLRELEAYAAPGGHFAWWESKSIYEIDFASLEDWSLWLGDRELSPKTRRNVIGAFRSFVGWLRRRDELAGVPEFPWPKVPEHEPRVLSIPDQDAVLEAIAEAERGIFLALAHLGLRPSEARALDVADVRDGWVIVDKAMKGAGRSAPIRGTKSGKGKRLPLGEELLAWIGRHVDPAARLARAPLFVNPRTRQRWTHWALRDRWLAAAETAGVPDVGLYEGTKHTLATDAVRRGVPERALQAFLGHSDVRSTRRYARMADEALVAVLRRPALADPNAVLAPVWPRWGLPLSKSSESQRKRASPTGFEPAEKRAKRRNARDLA